ncbi:MAG: translation elongation factor Ts [Betaproteobacteria bacterium]|nr:translation elongation factor Ts [Betaproteobacteria bacterium]
MEITATMVRELREQTGLGMMDCKKALTENAGDFEKAHDWLRKRGAAVADKKAGRATGEGRIAAAVEKDFGCLVQIGTETDFVARNEDFAAFAQKVADAVSGSGKQPQQLAEVQAGDQSVEQMRQAAAMQLGENIQLGEVRTLAGQGKLHSYVHHDGSIGVLADIEGGDDQLGRDICLHIAAMLPAALAAEDVAQEKIAKEREIYEAQAKESGKPAEITAKMVEGRVRKYIASVALLGQPFVKNPEVSVAKHLEEAKARVHGFALLTLAPN